MKRVFVFALLFVSLSAQARIGDSPQQAEKRYGKALKPLSPPYLGLGPRGSLSTSYIAGGLKISETYLDGVCEYTVISKADKTAFTTEEFKQAAKINAGDRKLSNEALDIEVDTSEGIKSWAIHYQGMAADMPSNCRMIVLSTEKYKKAEAARKAESAERGKKEDEKAAAKSLKAL